MNTTLELSEVNQKIGQLFMAGIPGPRLDEETESLIRDYHLGGIILFSCNIVDPVQVTKLCRDIQDKALKHHKHYIFLAVDQEGGRVARLGEPFTQFPGNAAISMDDNPIEKAREFALVTAREMKMVGLNMNLAPVVDVNRGRPEKHLEDRTFGEDPEMTAMLGKTVVKVLQENGIMAVAKHFPGLGSTGIDPHHNLPRIEMDMGELEEVNLLPFKAAIEEGVSAIMTSHAIYSSMDQKRPATMSPAILNTLLRGKMGFDGLVITDDLEMGAIAKHWGVVEGALASFEAGSDILLICKDQKSVLDSLNLLRRRLLRGEIPFERLNQSLERIEKVRSRFLGHKDEISLTKVEDYFRSRS